MMTPLISVGHVHDKGNRFIGIVIYEAGHWPFKEQKGPSGFSIRVTHRHESFEVVKKVLYSTADIEALLTAPDFTLRHLDREKVLRTLVLYLIESSNDAQIADRARQVLGLIA